MFVCTKTNTLPYHCQWNTEVGSEQIVNKYVFYRCVKKHCDKEIRRQYIAEPTSLENEAEKRPIFENMLRTYSRLRKGEELL